MALVNAVVVFGVSLVVGTVAILVAARLLVDSDAGISNAAFTALVGAAVFAAAVWATTMLVLDWIPLLGAALMLAAWVGIINWRYPGGWGTATTIGFVAWLVAVAIVYALAALGLLQPEALGVPGV